VTFTGAPGSTFKINFDGDGIDETKVANKDYMNTTNVTSIDYSLYVNLRDCEVGEYFTESGQCLMCPTGTTFTSEIMTEPGECEPCPDTKASCYGGTNVGPKSGYWRKSNYTANFLKCYNSDACLGMIPPDYDP
jgi:hypothetical protein